MSSKKISVIFAGTPDFAVPSLEEINLAGHDIKLILTQPDRKSGRGMNLKFSPVKEKSKKSWNPCLSTKLLKK
jgi:methionyl-tRNA formyltransferase